MQQELLYQIALTMVPNIGHVHTRNLVQHFGSASAILKAKKSELEKLEGIGTVRAISIQSFKNFSDAEREIAFIEKYNIQPLFITRLTRNVCCTAMMRPHCCTIKAVPT